MNYQENHQFSFYKEGSEIRLHYISLYQKHFNSSIVFFHANGYSAETYLKLLKIFFENRYNVFALNFSGHSQSENFYDFSDWYFFRDQVLAFLKHINIQFQQTIFHLVGHSLGGASSLLASAIEKDLIRSISCWDPVVLTPILSFFTYFIDAPLAPIAEKRRDQFKNLKVIERSFRMNPSFKYWDEEVFQDYLKSCFYFDETSNSYKLSLPKEIEAKIFRSLKYGHWKEYKKVHQPIFIYTTKNSQVCPIKACKLLIKNNSQSQYLVHPSGSHFFPMEDPVNTANETLKFINKIKL